MASYKVKLNHFTGQLQLVLDESSVESISFKPGVATVGDLPSSGNTKNDARIVNDTHHLYVWDGSVWQDQGDILDIDWSAITGKPTSSVADIDDAVTKKHTQGTDAGTRSATKIVAANNSMDKLKADYVCDGVDDQTEIKNAINVVNARGGGRVILLEGNYNISASGDTNGILFNVSNVVLEGQGLSTILNVSVSNGIYASTGNHNTIKNLKILNIGSYDSIALIQNNSLIKNVAIDGGTQGISIAHVYGISIIGCNIRNVIDNGIRIWDCYNVIIKDNFLSSNLIGINCSNGTYNTFISNNIIELGQQNGITLSGTNCILSNNFLRNNSQAKNNEYYEIYVDGNKYLIIGNNIYCNETNKAKYGIYEVATDDYNIITNNIIQGAVTAQILIKGANTEVGHNIEI